MSGNLEVLHGYLAPDLAAEKARIVERLKSCFVFAKQLWTNLAVSTESRRDSHKGEIGAGLERLPYHLQKDVGFAPSATIGRQFWTGDVEHASQRAIRERLAVAWPELRQ